MVFNTGAWRCSEHGGFDPSEVEGAQGVDSDPEPPVVTNWSLGMLDAIPVQRFSNVNPFGGHMERPEVEEGHALLLFPLSSPPDSEVGVKSAERQSVQRLLDIHGRTTLRQIVEGLKRGDSFAKIGREVGLTREYVRQLAGKLGIQTRMYVVHPEVLREAEEPGVPEAPLVFPPKRIGYGARKRPGLNPDED
jgi:hypothetical protein